MRVEHIGDATLVRIYALCEYPSWRPRYVGKTTQYMHERHKAHIRDAKRGGSRPVQRWIRKQIAGGDRLAIKLLEFCGNNWADREAYWIGVLRGNGLLNLTNGGEGLRGHRFTPEHRSKIAAALRTGNVLRCVSCGSSFYRKANAVAKGQCKFCSRMCANRWNKGGHRVA